MINYTRKEKTLPLIRSALSSEYLQPTQWIAELIEDRPDDIFGIIEKYEFIIACLIKTVSLSNIQDDIHFLTLADKQFSTLVDNICNKRDYYLKEYFHDKDDKFIFNITRFIFFDEKALITIPNAVSYFCKSWNEYYHWIFNKNENDITEDISVNNIDSIKKFTDLFKNINIPNINYDVIYNLLVFFEEEKNKYREKPKIKINPKAIVDDPDDLRNIWHKNGFPIFKNEKTGEWEIHKMKAFIKRLYEENYIYDDIKVTDQKNAVDAEWIFRNIKSDISLETIKQYIRNIK